ncbi:hypothetical protein LJC14_00500 [Treponema sp. OttesenSCG-928-L16]|nr:hypothetical protein [Treponema sp. OttesenSCG-928-L16]
MRSGNSMEHPRFSITALLALLLASAALMSCKSGGALKRDNRDGMMYGMIYDHENIPVSGVKVFINGDELIESDAQGRFVLLPGKSDVSEIRLFKDGYEEVRDFFTFDPMDVLYFKMINASQLLTLAEDALNQRRYGEAELLLSRSLLLDPYRPDTLFLTGITAYLRKDYTAARNAMMFMLSLGYDKTYVRALLEAIAEEESSQEELSNE